MAFLCIVILSLIYANILWRVAPNYEVKQYVPIDEPIMDMKAYEKIWNTHKRPYIYSIKSKLGGKVIIMGISHTKDVTNSQLDSIRHYWKKSNPDVALVEGKVGNLFTWFQDPIKELGEGGLVTSLAHKKGVEIYSWEPEPDKEVKILLKNFSKEQLAMFYSFRPYFSNMRYGKPSNPEVQLQEYLDSRTDNKYLKNSFSTWEELDNKWVQDFPNLDWRSYNSANGYPDGYLYEIWNMSNLIRDEHMLQVIFDLFKQKKNVFVIMGASHAPRIEKSLNVLID